jgi:DNA-binding CsgD family transcriptional regulator
MSDIGREISVATGERRNGRYDRKVLDVISVASEAMTLPELGRDALPLLARSVDAAETILYGLAEDGRPISYAGTMSHFFDQYAREYMRLDPQQEALSQRNLPVSHAARVLDMGAFRRTDVYHGAYLTNGIDDIVQVRLRGESYFAPGMATIALFRRPDQPAWGPGEQYILDHSLPALCSAARRATRLAEVLRARPIVEAMADAADPRPRCALDTRGRLIWISPRAATLLGGGENPLVPEALASAAGRLGALATGAHDGPLTGQQCLRSPGGSPLRTELSVAWTADGSPFIQVAIEDFSIPSPAAAALGARAGLTPAETSVLSVLSLGLSNAEIASRLFVSAETVRTHIQRILGKLGVRSRFDAILEVRGATPRRSSTE